MLCSFRKKKYINALFILSLSGREYLPMGGRVKMVEETLKLAYGENSEFIKDKRMPPLAFEVAFYLELTSDLNYQSSQSNM